MRIGYARVSTKLQDLTIQINELNKEGCEKIYKDKFTGTIKNRPEFNKLLEVLKAGDTLIITKLDRLGRSAKDAIEIIEDLFNREIKVHILNMGLMEDTPTGRLIFKIMTSFAEFERDMIVERTQAGLELARQDPNFKEGRPRVYSDADIESAIKDKKTMSYKQVTEKTGISKPTLYRAITKKKAEAITAETTQDQPIA